MTCVVLLGFSTTGKSSIISDFHKRYPEVETLDSDTVISKPDCGHIYKVFLKHREGYNTNPALDEIKTREREFLRSASPGAKPLLLAAGPFLHTREPEWRDFLGRVSPVCLYLQKDPEDVLVWLLKRRWRHSQDEDLASDPGFGCWDQNVTTEFRDGRWVELGAAKALCNVRKHMKGVVPSYERLSSQTFTWKERQTDFGKERLNNAIIQALGLPSTPR